ncbi:MAG: NAD(P)-dependent glycerol-3-phosphate dehydrogenase [Verrucomicrobia bacterium]|nr:NAD(P)-dependent glycerol-3-phosphate dehydrogenase [Verrucomicrobiota bacterium]
MKIGYLGTGTWGYALASLLANKGHDVVIWGRDQEIVDLMNQGGEHPNLSGCKCLPHMRYTTQMREALEGAEMICEGVTSAGIRSVFAKIKALGVPNCPIVLTSKGIEQKTGLLLSEVVVEMIGKEHQSQVGCVSGPSHAEEVVRNLPTSVVCSAYSEETMMAIQEAFNTERFRVYPNSDINGVEFSGAMKNIVAIACGISDGLGFGDNTKAALMTRGLHEIRKLALVMGCREETLNGLAGMGDLCVTCLSNFSRNYRFGRLLAEGNGPEEARKKIGMVVEGTYSVVSARELAHKMRVPLPITEGVYQILYGGLAPEEAVKQLLTRAIKEEHL